MGTQAHWMRSKYRYRVNAGLWLHADRLVDIVADTDPDDEIEIQRWEGRKRDGGYQPHTTTLVAKEKGQ
jgi:hypothetical protein